MRGVHAVIALFATFAIVSSGLSTAYDPTPPGASSRLSKAYDPTSPSSVSPSAAPPSSHALSYNEVHIEPNSSRVGKVPGLRFGSSIPKRLQVLFYASVLIATLAMTFLVIQCFRAVSAGSPGASSARRLAEGGDEEEPCVGNDDTGPSQPEDSEDEEGAAATPPGAQGPTTQPPLTVFALDYLVFRDPNEDVGPWEDDKNPSTALQLDFDQDGRPARIWLRGKQAYINDYGVPVFAPIPAPRVLEPEGEGTGGSKGKGKKPSRWWQKGKKDKKGKPDDRGFGPKRLYWPPSLGFRQEVWQGWLEDGDPAKYQLIMNKGPRPDGELVFGLDGRIDGKWEGGKVVPYDSAYQPPTHGFPPTGHQLKAPEGVTPAKKAGNDGDPIHHPCGKLVGVWKDGRPVYDGEPGWKPLEGRPPAADLDLKSEGNEVYDKKKKPLGCIAGGGLSTRYLGDRAPPQHEGPFYTRDGHRLGAVEEGLVTYGYEDSEGATGTSSPPEGPADPSSAPEDGADKSD